MRHIAPDPDFVPTTLGERIRAVRTAWGWTQNVIADILLVDQASVSFWERGKIKPSGSAIVAMSALFRLSPDALETGQGFVIPDPPTTHPESDLKNLRHVSLPTISSSDMAIVDMMNSKIRDKELSEMLVDLVEAIKAGRKVWLVVG